MSNAALATATTSTVAHSNDLDALHQSATALADASRATSTHKAYAKGWAAFTAFATSHGLADPMAANAMVVRLWVASMADEGLSVATITQRLTAVNQTFKGQGLASPALMSNTVAYIDDDGAEKVETLGAVLKGLRRTVADRADIAAGHRGQARALLADEIVSMVRLAKGDDLAAKRDRLLIALGFGAFLRRSELVALDVADLEPMPDGSVRIEVRSSKTDQEGKGATMEAKAGRAIRPAEMLAEWLDASGIESGPVFRPITKGGYVRPDALSDRSVSTILKRRAEAAGIEPGRVSGHSLRRGAATSARAAGADVLSICRAGRWEDGSATVNRYLDSASATGLDLGW